MVISRDGILSSGFGIEASARSHASNAPKYRMGIGTAAYMQRGRADRDVGPSRRFSQTQRFLDHCKDIGARGIQAPLDSQDERYADEVRPKAAEYGMCVEVSACLPGNDTEGPELFEKTVKATKAAGGSVIRAVMVGGRRYETLTTLDDWEEFSRQSRKSLTRAEPILRQHGVRLAIENDKD